MQRRGKGKAAEAGATLPRQARKKRMAIRDPSDEDEHQTEMEREMEAESMRRKTQKPEWKKFEPLSKFPDYWQENLYHEKMNSLRNKDKAMICERAVEMAEFTALGVVDCFTRLGWGATLRFHDAEGNDRIPMKGIIQWMASLERDLGNNPPQTMTLTGIVGSVKVVMSFDTIRQIAAFDSGSADEYVYPPESEIFAQAENPADNIAILQQMFRSGARGDYLRKDLNILPKLISYIMENNIIPRMGDKMKVRHYDLRVLHALVTGQERLSFRHLVMMNVWGSRESKEKKMIPHCRLITALLRSQNALHSETHYIVKAHKPITLAKLSKDEWKYTITDRYHILRDRFTKQELKRLKAGAQPDRMDTQGGEEEGGDESPEEGPESSYRGSHEGDPFEEDTMEAIIASRRPPGFDEWPDMHRYSFDRQTREFEEARRHRERQDLYARSQAFAFQEEINNRYYDSEQQRHYNDYYAGRAYQPNPAPVDWERARGVEPNNAQFPYPQSHSSRWVPTRQASEQSGSSDPFNFNTITQEMEALYQGWFGNQTPRPPYNPSDYDYGDSS